MFEQIAEGGGCNNPPLPVFGGYANGFGGHANGMRSCYGMTLRCAT